MTQANFGSFETIDDRQRSSSLESQLASHSHRILSRDRPVQHKKLQELFGQRLHGARR
ncbi:hypothetical protein APY03_2751 [Variovorax sp. WDL1]|nr:hypothetical protein APY03_2751 [Variovorax sp. WDL1]